MNILPVTDASFDEAVLTSNIPTLVEFWAEWCGPCKAMMPVLDALAAEFAGKVSVRKLDTDAEPRTASRFGIRAVPTLLLFKNGQIIAHVVGAVPRAKVEQMLGAANRVA